MSAGGLASGGIGSGGQDSMGGSGGQVSTGGSPTGGVDPGGGGAPTGGGTGGGGTGGADPNFHLFLLIGQSNMVGAPAPQAADKVEDPNVVVLGYEDCGAPLNRTYDEWSVAVPPLHGCYGGLGPGDYFGKTVAAAYPEAKIGLIPCGIPGVDIDYFRKDVVSSRRGEFTIPPDNHWAGAYEWVISRAQLAQQEGVIRGILFHQGESNPGQTDWPGKVAEMVQDLRTDLNLGPVPFLVGELMHSCGCSNHNPLIAQLPGLIEEAYVISAAGLAAQDDYHFNLEGQRTLGTRYAEKFLEVFTP